MFLKLWNFIFEHNVTIVDEVEMDGISCVEFLYEGDSTPISYVSIHIRDHDITSNKKI